MTSVLVTGAGGFIGSALLASDHGWHIDAVSRHSIDRESVRWLPTDAVRHGAVDTSSPYDAVVHLAGNANHRLAHESPWLDAQATAVLSAELLGRVSAAHLVVLSSAAVYAGHTGQVGPLTLVDPRMAYALSKLYVEGLARALVADGRFGGVTVLRLYNAFGPGERPSRLIPRVAEAVRANAAFRLTGATSSLADPLHVEDVARALVAAANRQPGGTLDVCGGDAKPLLEQVRVIGRVLGRPDLTVAEIPDPDEVPIGFWSDPSPTWRALDLDPPCAFADAVWRYARSAGWITEPKLAQDSPA